MDKNLLGIPPDTPVYTGKTKKRECRIKFLMYCNGSQIVKQS
ncbi:MAG: hypothetical protein Q9M89_06870 [Persephonella sp.]|nr:hypothetical protein [Persephonella sp.]